MSEPDNLFDKLFELFQTSGPVNWKLADEVTKSLTGAPEPIDPHLAEEYQELGLAAQLHVTNAVAVGTAPSDIDPIDRRAWAGANRSSFSYLVEPLGSKLSEGSSLAGPMEAMLAPLGPAIVGLQAGSMIGFMSHRVLGQFDVGLPTPGARPALVVPNVEAFASDHGLDARQVRLWAALHEVSHHAVLSVPWVADRLRDLVDRFFSDLEIDMGFITGQMQALEDPTKLQELLSGEAPPVTQLFKGEHQSEHLAALQAFTAFLEGYCDHAVAIAGVGLLPDLDRLAEAHARRRAEPTQGEQALAQLVGLTLQRHRARDAATFCDEIARRWGEDALTTVWESPDRLPDLGEFDDPVGWAARALLEG